MERHIFVIDPLPNVANGVKKTLAGLAGPDLTLVFEPAPATLNELRTALGRMSLAGKSCGLVIPLNSTSQVPVLDSYRSETKQPRADTFDLMASIRREWTPKFKPESFPFLMPFLSLENPESVLQRLRAKPNLTHVLGCLTSHILGITASIGRNEVIDENTLMKAFQQHFTRPEAGPFLIRDYVKFLATVQASKV